jgi:hypothetical protein
MAALRSSTVGPPMFGGPPPADEEFIAHWQSKNDKAASAVALVFSMVYFIRSALCRKAGERKKSR